MTFFARHKTNAIGPEEWLEIATHKLVKVAKKRIRLEIESHYADAVAKHLEKGEPEEAAIEMAMAELGDPRVARKDFRKRHLLESEAHQLKEALIFRQRAAFLIIFYVSCILFAAFVNLAKHGMFKFGLMLFFFAILPTVSLALTRGRNANKRVRIILVLDAFDSMKIWLFFLFIGKFGNYSGWYWIMFWTMILLSSFYIIWSTVRLIQKLERDWPQWPKPLAN